MPVGSWVRILRVHRRLKGVAMYLGPDVVMPLASALAAVAGVLMMFWRRVLGGVRAVFQAARGVVRRR